MPSGFVVCSSYPSYYTVTPVTPPSLRIRDMILRHTLTYSTPVTDYAYTAKHLALNPAMITVVVLD